jgi:rubredoxin
MTWSGWIYNKLSSPPTMEREAKRPEKIAMGFICPDCKVIFNSAEELSTHFSKSHETTSNRPNSAPSGNIYTTTGTAPISVPSKGNRESSKLNPQR